MTKVPSAPGPQEPGDLTVLHARDVLLTYADCDPAGILYFATWFTWMERVQSEWMWHNNLRQDTLLERFGFSVVTRGTECEYLAQARLFESIQLSFGIAHVGATSLRGEFQMVRNHDAVRVARGSITVVTIDASGHPIAVPEVLRSLGPGTASPD